MNKNLNDDAPLFPQPTAGISSPSEKLGMEKIKQESKRFNKLLTLGSKWIGWFLLFSAGVIGLDILYQKLGMDNNLLQEGFSLAKYALTTILGFVFANSSNRT